MPLCLVGMTGFEPATTRPQTSTLTGLSYIRLRVQKVEIVFEFSK